MPGRNGKKHGVLIRYLTLSSTFCLSKRDQSVVQSMPENRTYTGVIFYSRFYLLLYILSCVSVTCLVVILPKCPNLALYILRQPGTLGGMRLLDRPLNTLLILRWRHNKNPVASFFFLQVPRDFIMINFRGRVVDLKQYMRGEVSHWEYTHN